MKPHFSGCWYFAVTVINLLGCIPLAAMAFAVRMSSFSAGAAEVHRGLSQVELLAWVWTTGTMIAYEIFGMQKEILITAAGIWALVLGTIAGFVFPRLAARPQSSKPSRPEDW